MATPYTTHWHVITSGKITDPDGDSITVINAHPCNADLPCVLFGDKPTLYTSAPRSYEDGYTDGYDDGCEDATDNTDFSLTHDPFPE